MSLAVPTGRFGAGGSEPWSAVLRGGAAAVLELVRSDRPTTQRLDAARWLAEADAVDRMLLADLPGPVLDIGCGPGRMLRAAAEQGLDAWGLDADAAAVALCRSQGLRVLHGSVFDPTSAAGAWGAVLLLDGNIGIGGDVAAMLARCADLLRPAGVAVVEAHPDRRRDVTGLCRLRGADGGESDPFPWSEVGAPAVLRAADAFVLQRAWRTGGRAFVRLRRR